MTRINKNNATTSFMNVKLLSKNSRSEAETMQVILVLSIAANSYDRQSTV